MREIKAIIGNIKQLSIVSPEFVEFICEEREGFKLK